MDTIPENLKKELLALDANTITVSQISSLFGHTMDKESGDPFKVKPPKFDTTWKMHLDAGEYINKEAVDTHVGIFLFNKLLIEGNVEEAIPNGYYNEVVTTKKMKNLLSLIAKALLNNVITVNPQAYHFLRSYEFWSLKLVSIFSASYTPKLLDMNPKIEAEKKRILSDPNSMTMVDMVNAEDKLVDMANQIIGNDPGKALFNSGARGSFENDYKNMILSVGPTMNPTTGEYDFIKSSYLDGISKEDLAAAANIIINAEYPKAIGTAKGGYLVKQLYAVFQNTVFGEPGSDCKTHEGLIVKIDNDNVSEYLDQYAFGKNGLVLITEENAKSWIGKTIKIRSPMFCTAEHICNKCAGERLYKVGIRNAGLTSINIGSAILNAGMKNRHSLKIKLDTVDVNKVLK